MATRTLPRGASIAKYPKGDGVRVAELVAHDIGCTVATARRRLNVNPRIRDWALAVVRAYRDCGHFTALARFLAPLEVEAAGLEAPHIDEALTAVSHATCAMQFARDAYDKVDEALATALVRTIDCQRSALLRLRHSVVQRHAIL